MQRMEIAWHASHEQFSPKDLLRWAVLAEQQGFTSIHSSDHFHPWSKAQGQSGFSFAWLGAAMQATSLPFSVICAPGYRYPPAVIAQAAGTLGQMFAGRFTLCLGTGERINEIVASEEWPAKPERNARLAQHAGVIRRLLAGETVGPATLYTRAAVPIFGAALTPETARTLTWADGLLTLKRETLPELPGKPRHVKLDVSYARSYARAKQEAWEQWRTNVLDSALLADARSPAELETHARDVTPDDVAKHVLVTDDPNEILTAVRQLGGRVIVHHVGRDQDTFIRDVGNRARKQDE